MIIRILIEDNSTQIKSLIEEFQYIDFVDLTHCFRSGEECISAFSYFTELPDFALLMFKCRA